MARDFDSELAEDREFKIGGETFRWRYPMWRDRDIESLSKDKTDGEENTDSETTVHAIEDLIERISSYIHQDDVDRWKAVATSETSPIPLHQFQELYRWLLEVTSGRPTETPSPSPTGAGSTDPS